MFKKSFNKSGKTCRVTFALPDEVGAKKVHLCGEFNDWDEKRHPMKRRKDGHFATTLTLETGRDYRFRYLLDGKHWENDWQADAYVPNSFGSEDSVVQV